MGARPSTRADAHVQPECGFSQALVLLQFWQRRGLEDTAGFNAHWCCATSVRSGPHVKHRARTLANASESMVSSRISMGAATFALRAAPWQGISATCLCETGCTQRPQQIWAACWGIRVPLSTLPGASGRAAPRGGPTGAPRRAWQTRKGPSGWVTTRRAPQPGHHHGCLWPAPFLRCRP